jgi:hypothetical protein
MSLQYNQYRVWASDRFWDMTFAVAIVAFELAATWLLMRIV